MRDFYEKFEDAVEAQPWPIRFCAGLMLLPFALAASALGFALEEGWGRRFFAAIGITASN